RMFDPFVSTRLPPPGTPANRTVATVVVALVVRVNVLDPLVIETEVFAAGEAEKVPIAFAAVPLLVSVSVFGLAPDESVIVIEPPPLGGAVKVPTTLPGVALVVIANVFDPLVTEMEVSDVGAAEKVPVAFEPVPLFVSVSALELAPEEFVTVIEPAAGLVGPEKVPTALPRVAFVVMANVFDPLATEMDVSTVGAAGQVPMAFEPVPLFVSVSALELAPDELVIVMEPADGLGGAEKVPTPLPAVALVVL